MNFCYNVGTINPDQYGGGIVGVTRGTVAITNCKNEGAVNCDGIGGGGIVGYAEDASTLTIADCYNSGSITSTTTSHGIVGDQGTMTTGNISYCYNIGTVSAASIGGIANNTYTISHSYASTDGSKPLTISAEDLAGGHFYENPEDQGLTATICSGKTWRNEEAGRLFKNDSLFYVSWDGKYDNGECVTGEITVDYQKNSGVTHFPFYDPENINPSAGSKGMVVYRISPIQDSIKADPSKYNYSYLPENYYQTSTYSSTEQGIELKLYWDDRRISKSGACGTSDLYGETITPTTHECTYTPLPEAECTDFYTTTGITYCAGIENVTEGG